MSNDLTIVAKEIAKRYHSAAAVDELRWSTEKQHFLAVIGKSKDLKQATPDSLRDAALQAASMGLSFNPLRQHVYLIPRRARKKRQGESDADYDNVPVIAGASPSYRGLSHIATSGGGIARFLRAEIVYKKDFFVYKGPADKPEHKACIDDPKAQEYNQALGVYALCKTKEGDWLCEWVNRETVLKIRARSDFPNSLMWKEDALWTEGWKKAAIRRLCKTIPQSDPRMDAAMQVMNQHEGMLMDEPQDITPEVVQVITDQQATELDALLEDAGIEGEAKKTWLSRAAFATSGVKTIQELPAAKFTEAKDKLKEGLKARAARPQK